MAFWGVEVKPGRPFTHVYDGAKGRLRVSHATLGNGSASSATKRVLVQCNVGNRSPVLLCSLWPDKTDSCPVGLEFEEAEEVIFSVIGPRSVNLVGYYLSRNSHSCGDNDIEPYGEDIADTESGESSLHREEGSYEDSFINDDEPEVFPPSPVTTGREDEKPKGGTRKRLRKYRLIESDEETPIFNSDAERDLGINANQPIKKRKKNDKKEASQMTADSIDEEVTLPSEDKKARTLVDAADQHADPKPSQVRTLSSGLVITELEPGTADGKVASHGKKVRVHFIGRLKGDDQIFDTNIGQAPLKFRLGGRKVVEGLNIGVDGMRVGGKRKLIIPPSLGYGTEGDGDRVPPNSWLVYDIELVKVR